MSDGQIAFDGTEFRPVVRSRRAATSRRNVKIASAIVGVFLVATLVDLAERWSGLTRPVLVTTGATVSYSQPHTLELEVRNKGRFAATVHDTARWSGLRSTASGSTQGDDSTPGTPQPLPLRIEAGEVGVITVTIDHVVCGHLDRNLQDLELVTSAALGPERRVAVDGPSGAPREGDVARYEPSAVQARGRGWQVAMFGKACPELVD